MRLVFTWILNGSFVDYLKLVVHSPAALRVVGILFLDATLSLRARNGLHILEVHLPKLLVLQFLLLCLVPYILESLPIKHFLLSVLCMACLNNTFCDQLLHRLFEVVHELWIFLLFPLWRLFAVDIVVNDWGLLFQEDVVVGLELLTDFLDIGWVHPLVLNVGAFEIGGHSDARRVTHTVFVVVKWIVFHDFGIDLPVLPQSAFLLQKLVFYLFLEQAQVLKNRLCDLDVPLFRVDVFQGAVDLPFVLYQNVDDGNHHSWTLVFHRNNETRAVATYSLLNEVKYLLSQSKRLYRIHLVLIPAWDVHILNSTDEVWGDLTAVRKYSLYIFLSLVFLVVDIWYLYRACVEDMSYFVCSQKVWVLRQLVVPKENEFCHHNSISVFHWRIVYH